MPNEIRLRAADLGFLVFADLGFLVSTATPTSNSAASLSSPPQPPSPFNPSSGLNLAPAIREVLELLREDYKDVEKYRGNPNVSGIDGFVCLYFVEADIEATLEKVELASQEKNRVSAVALNTEIRRTKDLRQLNWITEKFKYKRFMWDTNFPEEA